MPTARQASGGIRTANTTVVTEGGVTRVTLYATTIFTWDRKAGIVKLNTGGYNTPTTLRRMNEVLHHFGMAGHHVVKADFKNGNVIEFNVTPVKDNPRRRSGPKDLFIAEYQVPTTHFQSPTKSIDAYNMEEATDAANQIARKHGLVLLDIRLAKKRSNPRQRSARRNPRTPFARFRVYVHDPSYGKPFYGTVLARQDPPYEVDRDPWGKHGPITGPAFLIQRSDNSGATWYASNQFRRLKGAQANPAGAQRVTKREWYDLGGFANSKCFRKQARSGAWQYFIAR